MSATSDAGLTISYSSSNTSVATVSGNSVTIIGAGNTNITASQDGNQNYHAATDVTQTLTVTPKAITVTADAGQSKVFGSAEPELTYTITSGNLVGSDVLTGNVTREVGEDVGFYSIQQGNVANPNYDITFVTNDFEITKANQVIIFNALTDVTYGDADFNLSATSDAGLTISYSSSNTSVATVSGNSVTIIGAGNTTITASQDGNQNYHAATAVLQSLTIVPRAITLTANAGQSKISGTTDPFLNYTITNGNLIAGDVLTGNLERTAGENAGMYAINQGTLGNDNYDITFVPNTFEITKASQTITFNSLLDVTYGDSLVELQASASSSLPITYSCSNTSVATIVGNTINIIGAGTTSIIARQAGNENYQAAAIVNQTLTVLPKAITVAAEASQRKVYGTTDPILNYTITNGNLVVSDVLAGNLNRTTGEDVGTYAINQGTLHNPNYAITFTSDNFEITKATQSITFDELLDVRLEDPKTFNLSAIASSGLAISYTSSDRDVATISGNIINIIGEGTVTISAHQSGNENYHPANFVSRTLTVLPGANEETTIKLYPNPVIHQVQISNISSNNRLSIYNANGKLVKQVLDYSNDEPIKVTSLPSGIYMVEILFFDNQGKTIIKKFVKQ